MKFPSSPVTLAIAAGAAVAVLLWSRKRSSPTRKEIKDGKEVEVFVDFPTMDGGLPILGNFTALFNRDSLSQTIAKYGKAFYFYLGTIKFLFLYGGEYHKWAFVKGENKYVTAGWPPRWKKLMGEKSVTAAIGSEHRKLRQLLSKGLSRSTISYFYPSLRANARKSLQDLVEASENGTKDIEPIQTARLFTYNAICGFIGCADPKHEEVFRSLRADFVIWSDGLGDLLMPEWLPWFSPYVKAMQARQRIHEAVTRVVFERRERMKAGEEFKDCLGHLMTAKDEDGEEFSVDAICDNFIILAFAGNDTATTTICNLLHILLFQINPDELAALKDELVELEEPIAETTINSLPVLDAFIKEVLRIHPPVVGVFKQMTQDEELEPGKIVKAGTYLNLPIIENHYQEHIFPNPDQFLLSRFLVDEVDKNYPHDFAPFGNGQRMCMGMQLAKTELKLFVAELIRNFDIEKSSKPSKVEVFPFNIRVPSVKIRQKLHQ
ncbi:hypothetical protein HDU97_007542 [Phlyctochytrium planicorne]|nr:hypothetical protein HDU97_007542 [Phlyctochytrium planicorne]